ncbi:MAG: plasmid maintenance system killer protein [Bacteroidetes bacterium]|nr:plasmid maintenance system killer protein [Bacteroidota bacterium]NCQ11624.1 plasmid maintenance system killer protein [Bacteroidota bacterium]
MEIKFEKDYLLQLYENGTTKNKKYRFQKDVIKKYKNAIDKLRAAQKIEDLYLIKSLNYEKLVGDKKGFESIRVDLKFRIEFISSIEGDEPNCITICSIVELSNHYK